jgi:hypothetical protein
VSERLQVRSGASEGAVEADGHRRLTGATLPGLSDLHLPFGASGCRRPGETPLPPRRRSPPRRNPTGLGDKPSGQTPPSATD